MGHRAGLGILPEGLPAKLDGEIAPFWGSISISCGPADICRAQSPSDLQIRRLVPKTLGSADPKAKQREGSLPLEIPHARLSPTSSQTHPLCREGSAEPTPVCPNLTFHLSHPIPAHPGACPACQHPLEIGFAHSRGISEPFSKARKRAEHPQHLGGNEEP